MTPRLLFIQHKKPASVPHCQSLYSISMLSSAEILPVVNFRILRDDGVVLSVVLDAAQGRSFLLVLDAASLGEIARAYVPHPILFGYHGEYFQT